MPYRFYLINHHRCLGSRSKWVLLAPFYRIEGKKKWLDHNLTVISAHSNKRTSHSKITDLESNAFPIHLKVCLQSSTT